MDRGAWWVTMHGVKEVDMTAGLTLMMMMLMVGRWIFGKNLKLIN